jgi:hypothetical protein
MKIFKPLTVFVLAVFCYSLFAASAPDKVYTGDDQVKDSKQTSTRPDMYNRVHRAGLFWLNVTNRGYFGNPSYESKDPCTGKTAVSGELPGGSGTDFLFVGSLLFGGYLNNGEGTNGGTTFIGPLVTTGYEGWRGEGSDDMAKELWPVHFTEDPSGRTMGKIIESSNVEGRISCLFEEVYDPLATAEEQFSVMYTDKYVDRTYTGRDDYDRRDHYPLGIEIRQKSYAWSYDYAQKFVIIDYTLYNRNDDAKDIYNFFMGVYLDCDIGHTSGTSPSGGQITANHGDDIGGFIQKWDKYIDPATNQQKTVDLNLAWAADNDGRNYIGAYDPEREPRAGEPLDGATSIATVRVLRNPNPNLRYAFNMYVADDRDESIDWGPRWQTGLHPRPAEDHPTALPHERRDDPRSKPWIYDLTLNQKGYDDYNQDGLLVNANLGPGQLYGGRTEGRPSGDKGRYMVMSNDEFDYDQTNLRQVHLGTFTDPSYTEPEYAQAAKWQRWTTPALLGQPGYADDIVDGSIKEMNDLANGRDVKYVLSFGPLGSETHTDLAWDSDGNGSAESKILNKKVWRFMHGDSLKLTLAFIVNENFHTSIEQDPNYADDTIVDLNDGLDTELFSKGWYDALYNVVWAEKVYDIPMFDTKVTKLGETKGDGWYGEDVGADGIFGDLKNDTYCWWLDTEYTGPDAGERDDEITTFTSPITDLDGWTASNEDMMLPYGRKAADSENKYGITGDAVIGDRDGYGYMVRYDVEGGVIPQGTWIRFGFANGKLDRGDGVPDFTGPPPPPSPKTKISYDNNNVVIEWQSHEFFVKEGGFTGYTGSELYVDPFTRIKDFEGFQIQISPDVNSQNYVEVFSVDKTNYIYEDVRRPGEYLDVPFETDDPSSFDQIIHEDGKEWQLKPYGNNRSITEDHSKEGIYTYTAVKDSIVIAVDADTDENIHYWKYKFILHDKIYAKQNYLAVTASDFGDPKTGTPPLKSNPSINGTSVIPTKVSGTKDIYVVPNPYRGDADYEAMGWENTDKADIWSEQDRKIVFMNVPLRSVLKIYTLAGDLVKTITHNGNTRVSERYQYGEYGISWDLINDNNQAVVSGIYLFSVQDVDDSGYEQVGKFVIIK